MIEGRRLRDVSSGFRNRFRSQHQKLAHRRRIQKDKIPDFYQGFAEEFEDFGLIITILFQHFSKV